MRSDSSRFASCCTADSQHDSRASCHFIHDLSVLRSYGQGCSSLSGSLSANRFTLDVRDLASAGYSNSDLDKIISDMFTLKQGGSAAAKILPETEVCTNFYHEILSYHVSLLLQFSAGITSRKSCPCSDMEKPATGTHVCDTQVTRAAERAFSSLRTNFKPLVWP